MSTDGHKIKQRTDLGGQVTEAELEMLDIDRKEVVTISVTSVRGCMVSGASAIILGLLAAEKPGTARVLGMRELPEFSEPRLNKPHDAEDRPHDATIRRVLSSAL